MRQHSLSVENIASSHRQGQPHPSLSKGFRAYRISFASIPRRRISVYLLPPRPNPIYRLPIDGYGKGTGWSNAATFIVGRKRCAFSSPMTDPIPPFLKAFVLIESLLSAFPVGGYQYTFSRRGQTPSTAFRKGGYQQDGVWGIAKKWNIGLLSRQRLPSTPHLCIPFSFIVKTT